MQRWIRYVFTACVLAILPMAALAAQPLNVFMIAIDDYNDWSGYLQGHPQARTPNIDAFANQAVRFNQAYCNSPSCNPSRGSLLMGKYPNSTGLYCNQFIGAVGTIDLRVYYPKAVTIPQYFKANGYATYRTGKIFHLWGDWNPSNTSVDMSFETTNSGSTKVVKDSWRSGINFIYDYCDWGSYDQPYADFGEYSRASVAIQFLNNPHPKPFFIACGFYLPHLPWYYPKSILNEPGLAHIKNVNDVALPKLLEDDLNDLSQVAKDLAHSADSKPKSLNGKVTYDSWHQAITLNDKWKEAIQAYLASIFFVDMQIGRIMDAVEKSPYKDNTIIILWSDHGWLLGQKEAWSKYKPWQQSVRSNLIIKMPGVSPAVIDRPVSHIDIYPTLCELAGIPLKKDLDGRSLAPLLRNPTMAWDHPVVTAHLDNKGGWQTVRNERYTYIRYYTAKNEEELYDRNTDSLEWYNLAGKAEYASIKNQLRSYTPAAMKKLGSWDSAKTAVHERMTHEKTNLNSGEFHCSAQELRFSLVNAEKAALAVFDLKGKIVRDFTAIVRSMNNGENGISLTPHKINRGTYVVRFCDGKNSEIRASIIR